MTGPSVLDLDRSGKSPTMDAEQSKSLRLGTCQRGVLPKMAAEMLRNLRFRQTLELLVIPMKCLAPTSPSTCAEASAFLSADAPRCV